MMSRRNHEKTSAACNIEEMNASMNTHGPSCISFFEKTLTIPI
jgi:hypothetical protein